MANSQGRVSAFAMSILQYYNIVWKYNITYVLYTAISQGRVSVCLYYNIIQYFVDVQYNVRTLYG